MSKFDKDKYVNYEALHNNVKIVRERLVTVQRGLFKLYVWREDIN